MPKVQDKKNAKPVEEHLSEEEYEEEIDEDEEVEVEIEEEEEAGEAEESKRKRLTPLKLFDELIQRFNNIERAEAKFNEKQKEFDQVQKEFNTTYRKNMRELSNYIKRFDKHYRAQEGKKKARKTGNAGKGGFNKPVAVPEKLRNFIGIDEDELKTRPEITKLLNAKFAELGLVEERVEDNKKTNIIKLNASAMKTLGVAKKDSEILKKDIQSFIAKFYHEAKAESAT
jgi:hypothetical protein